MSKVENFGDVPRRIRELVAEVERLRANLDISRVSLALTGQAYEDARDEVERLREEAADEHRIAELAEAERDELRDEVKRLRERDVATQEMWEQTLDEVERLRAEKKVMLFPAIKKWKTKAEEAEAEVERLRADNAWRREVAATFETAFNKKVVEVERLRVTPRNDLLIVAQERDFAREEVERLRAALEQVRDHEAGHLAYIAIANEALEGSSDE